MKRWLKEAWDYIAAMTAIILAIILIAPFLLLGALVFMFPFALFGLLVTSPIIVWHFVSKLW